MASAATAQGPAVDGGDDGFGESFDAGGQCLSDLGARQDLLEIAAGEQLLEFRQISTRHEGLVSRSRDDHDPHFRIALHVVEDSVQDCEGFGIQRVELFRAVQRDPRNALLRLDPNTHASLP